MNVLKTIEYAFPAITSDITCTTSMGTTTNSQLANTFTLHCPESTGRTFKSVYVEFGFRHKHAGTSSVSAWRVQAQLNGASVDEVTRTQQINQSGDVQFWSWRHDITSHFASNFTGTSMTFDLWIAVTLGTGTLINNLSCKLVMTYEFDDTANSTRVKTVRIPLESQTGLLTNVLTEIGTNQVPQLTGVGGILPEDSVTVRDIFFEISTNDAGNGTTDFSLELALDAEAATGPGVLYQGLNTAVYLWFLWKRTDMTTTAAHAFKARSTLTSRFTPMAIVLHVTYTYNHAATTRILNSVVLPSLQEGASIGSTGLDSIHKTSYMISEPGTLTMRQSGIFATHVDSAGNTVLVKVGQQASYRTYTQTAGSAQAGYYFLTHRIDSGGALGLGTDASLARGMNSITHRAYTDNQLLLSTVSNYSSYIILNYESDVPTGGDGRANHTVHMMTVTAVVNTASNMIYDFAAYTSPFPSTDYWNNGVTLSMMTGTTITTSGVFIEVKGRHQAGEENTGGWRTLLYSLSISDGEATFWKSYAPQDFYKRFPADVTRDWLLSNGRAHRWQSNAGGTFIYMPSLVNIVTLHHVQYNITGTVSGYTGDGSGITVKAHRLDTGELVGSATTAAGGTYSIPWYNDQIAVFAHARQSDTLAGRSDEGTIA